MEAGKNKSILVTKPSQNQMKDAGMAFTLICIIIGVIAGSKAWLAIGILLQLINMVYSRFYYFPAIFWFSLANVLGFISSKVLLTLIFFLVVTPIGLFRKLLRMINISGKSNRYDSLKLRQWKKSTDSVFKTRNYKFSKKDLIKPY
jgi:hypothetical protein